MVNGHQRGASQNAALFGIAVGAWALASWLTHVIVCFKAGAWGFLIAGALLVPIAFVHGTGIWFGAW